MTTLIQRMREDLVRRNYAESTIRAICTLSRIFGGTLRSGWIIWDRTTSGAIRFTCGKKASSTSERHRTMLPPSGSFT